MSWWAVAAAGLVIVVVVWGVTTWLLGEAAAAVDPAAARVEAIKTGLGIGAGTAGVFALLLAVRRQWHQEITAADTTFDATERRVTELYTKAAEQLGSDKAPVRLAGLYALERLAQDHVEQRQTIVNVLCAYLRMPYALPSDPPADDVDDKLLTAHRERVQEREVRLAAQRILAHHLRPGPDGDNPVETFWADIDLDLTGATLINFNLQECTTRDARLNQATFTGTTLFVRATFTGDTRFDQATFTSDTRFIRATFAGDIAWFGGATFTADADFGGATFDGMTGFPEVTFSAAAEFTQAIFTNYLDFSQVTFTGPVNFSEANFAYAEFTQATFTGNTNFRGASFGDADFAGAALPGTCYTGPETPPPWTDLVEARFTEGVPPEVKRFVSSPDEKTEKDGENTQ